MQVAVFGGSFNPPHIAHVLAVTYVASLGLCERVLVVPVCTHAFDKHLAPFAARLDLCRRAMGFIPGVEISDIESRLPPPNYTLHMLQALAAEHPTWQLRLVVGADVLGESHKWHAWAEVQALAPLLVLGRVGYARADAPPAVLPDVSSTRIRTLLARLNSRTGGANISDSLSSAHEHDNRAGSLGAPGELSEVERELAQLLPKCVRDAIAEGRLYR